MNRSVLFLCTGNYYRSRFCEIYFNHMSEQRGLAWRAISKGLWQGETGNPGPISIFTIQGLAERGIVIQPENEKYPEQPTQEDFEAADRVIAVDEEEHRPMMKAQFPQWEDQIDYWFVHDIGFTEPKLALARLEERVEGLVRSIEMDRVT